MSSMVSDKRFLKKHKEVLKLRRQVKALQAPIQALAQKKLEQYLIKLGQSLAGSEDELDRRLSEYLAGKG